MTITRTCLGCDGRKHFGKVADFLRVVSVPCLACLGSGQVTDRITVQDALADAETLRTVAEGRDYWPRFAAEVHDGIAAQDEFWAGDMAEQATRLAFRAVPGLRG